MDDPFFPADNIEEEIEEHMDLSVEPEEDDEYEEIDSDEVDRVVAALENLSGQIQSENIRHLIDEASNNIYYLVYSEDEEDEEAGDVFEDAA